MALNEERMRILKMLEEGKIKAEEAAKLLEALEEPVEEGPRGQEKEARWFRVRVTDTKTGKQKVNINIPLGLAKMGLGIAAQVRGHAAGIDLDEIFSTIKGGLQGQVIDVEDEEKGERVEISVE